MRLTKNHLFLGFFIAGLTLVVSGCGGPQGSVADGKRWYMMHNCWACHGLNGDDGKGPIIRDKNFSFRSFLGTVRNANSPIMPKFPEEKISKQDVADIYAWLKTK